MKQFGIQPNRIADISVILLPICLRVQHNLEKKGYRSVSISFLDGLHFVLKSDPYVHQHKLIIVTSNILTAKMSPIT